MLIEQVRPAPLPAVAASAVVGQTCPFCLDSGMQIGSFGRYSFVGCDPFAVLRSKDAQITVTGHGAQELCDCETGCAGLRQSPGNPFDMLDDLLAEHELPRTDKPVPLAGGLVGYLGYDLCHHLERLPRTTEDDIAVPDLLLGAYDVVYGYDHETREGYVLSTGLPERGARGEARARERAAWLKSAISGPAAPRVEGPASGDSEPARNFTREQYLHAVARAIEYIYAGDIFQVNLSQRFDAELHIPAWELHLRLRERNPAPFAAYLDFARTAPGTCGEMQVVSASPERFIRATGRCLQTRPVKGTRPRGRTEEEDRRLAEELLASAKDRAELTMIVDLERNDLGRVCSFGSVKVPDLFTLESYPTVHHLVGTVTGELRPDMTYVDLLQASLPGGSITGAPKVRAMEIIDELEPTQRGVYTGCIGYIGFDWEMDLNIVIRTLTVTRGRAYWHVGGGIVADSTPEAEYQETLDKGLALAEALGFEAPAWTRQD